MYMHGNGTSFDTNVIFQQDETWDMGVSINWLNLTETDMGAFTSLEWLVINNITVDSMAVGNMIDYVQIYNPGAAMIDLRGNYAFQKNDGNNVSDSPMFPINAASLEPNMDLGQIDPAELIWVNLSAIPGLNIDSADELKLVWMNPATPGAPNGGNDVIVDRVEWGNQQMEPDNTTMGDAPEAMNTISRIVMGQDTNNCTVDFDASAEVPWPIIIPDQVVITATHVGTDVRLDWTPIGNAYGYKVYVYNDATFAGFVLDKGNPTVVLLGSATSTWLNVSGYDSPEDYGYIVRSYASGGENTTDGDNIAYKYRHTLTYDTGGGAFAGHNFLSLPYQMDPNIASANQLAADIGIANGNVQKWVAPNWDMTDFALAGGEAYRVIIPGPSNITYTIVGAHRGAPLNLQYGASKGQTLNFVSVPYHTTMMTATDLMTSVGSPRVAKWDGVDNLWLSKTMIGIDFPVMVGEGYLVVTTVAGPWAPPVRMF
jgi:hypothetical protein